MRKRRPPGVVEFILLLSSVLGLALGAPSALRRSHKLSASAIKMLPSEGPERSDSGVSATRQHEEFKVHAALTALMQHPEQLHALSDMNIKALNLALGTAALVSHAEQEAPLMVPALKAVPSVFSSHVAGIADSVSLLETTSKEVPRFSFDLSQMKMAQLGSTLCVMAIVAILGAIVFEYWYCKREQVEMDMATTDQIGDEVHEKRLLHMLSGVWPLVWPYLCNSQRPRYYIVTMAILGLWDLFLGVVFTIWMKEFWDIIEHKQGDQFLPIMKDSIVLLLTWILVVTYKSYISMMLVIDWRQWMTQWLMTVWMRDKTYYQMQLNGSSTAPDNPDQRLQEDVQLFVQSLVHLVEGLARAVGQMVSMLPLLLVLSPVYAFGVFYCPGWLLYLAMIYSGLGTLAAHWIGGKLIVVNFTKQRFEADFRYNIVQVRDHAESIALYGSEECERSHMNDRFDNIVRVWWAYMLHTKRLGFFTAFYQHSSHTFPYLALAPNYFKGQISLGTMFMLFTALGSVKGAFDWVIASYTPLTEFRATTDRLHNFWAAISKCKGSTDIQYIRPGPTEAPVHVLVAKDIHVRLPDSAGGRVVWRACNLSIRAGEFVLLSAPEGSGKSCFFRALAGIWPHASGTVVLPGNTLFVPQKSHIPQGSLKQAVTYPESEDRFEDQQIRNALEAVGLQRTLGSRPLSDEANWALVLSGGEAQRLAIAHALLMRPSLLCLDEATSAMGDEGALDTYRLLKRPGALPEGATVVSISHHVDLLTAIHDSQYTYSVKQGIWIKGSECTDFFGSQHLQADV